jgi:carbon monoxide dehydrogenase subunit G
MKPIVVSRDVAAKPDAVWSVITDLAGSPNVVSAIDRIEVLTEGPFAVGTRWRESRTMFGKSATEEMTVSALEPGRSYTVVADSNGVHYESSFVIEEAATGSRLTMTFGGEATSSAARVMGALMSPFLKGSMSKALAKDLDDLAAAAEALS